VNGKRDKFERSDLIALANAADIKKVRARQMLDLVIDAVRQWPEVAGKAGITDIRIKEIQKLLRINL
jgi:hypothetical protein